MHKESLESKFKNDKLSLVADLYAWQSITCNPGCKTPKNTSVLTSLLDDGMVGWVYLAAMLEPTLPILTKSRPLTARKRGFFDGWETRKNNLL